MPEVGAPGVRGSAPGGLTPRQARLKRAFDLAIGVPVALLTSPIALVGTVIATLDTREAGIFAQERVGLNGERFRVYKIRTMRSSAVHTTTVTTARDTRITRVGAVLRRLKIDELPQLVNVLRGEMSLVGPRPDVPGWADLLLGDDRIILSVRPGITGPASLAFRHEAELLAGADDPEAYNREVIWPEKVRINRGYVRSWSLLADARFLWATVHTTVDRSPT